MTVLNLQRKPYFLDVAVKDIKVDKSVQMRASLNRSAIVEYADNYEHGVKMPPPVIFWIPGQPKWLADGFHRVLAKRSLTSRGISGHKEMRCEIRTGTKRDAMLYAAGCNRTHGVRRTNEDKAKTVLAFLADKEWVEWADKEIARHAGVSDKMVAKYRSWLGEKAESRPGVNGQQQRTFMDNQGRTRTTSVPSPKEEVLDKQLSRELCPYCGQKMPGQKHGRRHGKIDRKVRNEGGGR